MPFRSLVRRQIPLPKRTFSRKGPHRGSLFFSVGLNGLARCSKPGGTREGNLFPPSRGGGTHTDEADTRVGIVIPPALQGCIRTLPANLLTLSILRKTWRYLR